VEPVGERNSSFSRLRLFGSLALLLIYILWILREPGFEPVLESLPILGGIVLLLLGAKPTRHFVLAAVGLGVLVGSVGTLLASRYLEKKAVGAPLETEGGAQAKDAVTRQRLGKCEARTSFLTHELGEARRNVDSLQMELAECSRDSESLPPPVVQSVTQQNFRFDLVGCQRSGEEVVCSVTVTSLDKDRLLLVAVDQVGGIRVVGVGYTKLVDDSANTYVAKAATIGNQTNEVNGQIELELVGDLPTPLTLTFSGLSQRAKSAAKLEITCSTRDEAGGRRRMFQPVFRNIRIVSS
jgi:hypothetical protein